MGKDSHATKPVPASSLPDSKEQNAARCKISGHCGSGKGKPAGHDCY